MTSLKEKIDLDIDPTAKFEMEEMAIRGGQAERWEPSTERAVVQPVIDRIDELVERVKAQQQVDVHGMVKRYFQGISLPALFAVATDNYIAKSEKRLRRTSKRKRK